MGEIAPTVSEEATSDRLPELAGLLEVL